MKKYFLSTVIIAILICGFTALEEPRLVLPANWPAPVYDFSNNPLSQDKINLGRALFYDPVLSRDSSISCNTCHSSYNAFAHVDHALSHGIDNRTGRRNAPALMNLAWQPVFMWDGAINHLDMQALAPMTHPDEMGNELKIIIPRLQSSNLYEQLFQKAWGEVGINSEHMLKSIAQFLLSIQSNTSKYDSIQNGEATFTKQEENGYSLFRQHCASCHTEPLFTNYAFENNGLQPDSSIMDFGRVTITHRSEDTFKFKVPTLRNIEYSYPYMHDGRFRRLGEVIDHYTSKMMLNPLRSNKLANSIVLNANQKVDLIAFLMTLTDKSFLFDPRFGYPREILRN